MSCRRVAACLFVVGRSPSGSGQRRGEERLSGRVQLLLQTAETTMRVDACTWSEERRRMAGRMSRQYHVLHSSSLPPPSLPPSLPSLSASASPRSPRRWAASGEGDDEMRWRRNTAAQTHTSATEHTTHGHTHTRTVRSQPRRGSVAMHAAVGGGELDGQRPRSDRHPSPSSNPCHHEGRVRWRLTTDTIILSVSSFIRYLPVTLFLSALLRCLPGLLPASLLCDVSLTQET